MLGITIIRPAAVEETEVVSSVLTEAAEWLERRGEPLWAREELTASSIRSEVAAGIWVLALSSHDVIGVARLTPEDPRYWPDAAHGDALYLHRLAVRRSHAGGKVSRAILDWASDQAELAGRRYLRLDCRADRPRLRAVYERSGFVFHSTRSVGPHFVARYEKIIPGARS
jgi:GNAT superfamily N-acetyltransferase